MKSAPSHNVLKRALGLFPVSARIFQAMRPDVVPPGSFDISRLGRELPKWCDAIQSIEPWLVESERKRVLIIASLKWWTEYGIALGLLLKAAGHSVDLAFLPYRDWTSPISDFDALRGVHHTTRVFAGLGLPFGVHSLITELRPGLDKDTEEQMRQQAFLDVQYTLQREEIDVEGNNQDRVLYRMRLTRNRRAAASVQMLLADGNFDVVIIPNGSILEFGAAYRVARKLGTDTVTYEFGEQRERVWLAQNAEVMRQDTTDLWEAVKDIPLQPEERSSIEKLFQARRGGQTWEQFRRQWQAGAGEGALLARQKLGLDPDRPVVLLCTNVVADSMALNRQVFTTGMAEWLSKTVALFGGLHDYQLIVRVHPGEMLGAGHPSVEIVKDALPHQPEHVIVVPPESEINTYDLIELAQLGLVYTTTVGLEMCMHGLPVIVAGATHYKGKGFTDDPVTWGEYTEVLQKRLAETQRAGLSEHEVNLAWRYAYRFFFDYPFEFPWHLLSFWDDLSQRPFELVLEESRIQRYRPALETLVGQPVDWRSKALASRQAEGSLER
ncbi:MAG: hypothetical protein PVF85_01185 [Anaerolineales bacterium]|jgi:hypothetical protein